MSLPYERLDVYQTALQQLLNAHEIAGLLPHGQGELADQIKRASLSSVLNIAEGCGKFNQLEQRRFFGIARGSAMECAAALDAMEILGLIDYERFTIGKRMAVRIVQMLSRMTGQSKTR